MGTSSTFDEFMKQNDLEHHGIKGMKWGVRRSDKELARARGEKVTTSEDFDKVSAAKAKGRVAGSSSLSNNEMRAINERMQLERQYAQLTAPRESKVRQKGKLFVDKYIDAELGKVAKGNVKETVTYKVGRLILSSGTKKYVGKHR